MTKIYVQMNSKLDKIKPMHSVNNGPVQYDPRGISNLKEFAAAGIPFVRNHDASFYMGYGGEYTVDVHRIFRNFDADETLPESYDFMMTDLYMKSIYQAGSKVFYRLGARIEHERRKCGTLAPKDPAKWARICEHIIRHYTEGWADGFHYDAPYWEIWNEPNTLKTVTGGACWTGTREQFFELFEITAKHLKACFPHLKIGGPAVAVMWLGKDMFLSEFFPFLKENHVPLDFFSFHSYASDPRQHVDSIEKARHLCDEYGYSDTELILNEWNYIRGWAGDDWVYSLHMEKSLKGASFIAGSMCICQKTPLDHLMYYDARPCEMNGMFNTDFLTPLKGYYPFLMFNTLYQLGTEVKSGTDDDTVFVCAASGKDGGAVMVSYYEDLDEAEVKNTVVHFSGVSYPNGVEVQFWLLNEDHDMELVKKEFFHADEFELYLPMNLFTTYLLKIVPN